MFKEHVSRVTKALGSSVWCVVAMAFTMMAPSAFSQGGTTWQVCASGNGDCTWISPSSSLCAVMDIALPNDQIWVSKGTYYPDCGTGIPIEFSFDLPGGVDVYGHFIGTELDIDDRDPLAPNRESILDGDVPGSEQRLHVVRANAVRDPVPSPPPFRMYIDGFTIQNGNARGWSEVDSTGLPVGLLPANGSAGGGMLVTGTETAIIMCKFVGNSAGGSECWCAGDCCTWDHKMFQGRGGGLAFIGSTSTDQSAIVQNCVFTGNIAMRGTMPSVSGDTSGPQGGAIYKSAGFGPLTIMNSVFYGNVVDASEPGSCSCDCCPPIVFDWQASGGAFAQGEESCGSTTSGSLTEMWNCTVYDNTLIATSHTATAGSGILSGFWGTPDPAIPMEVRNTIVWANTPATVGQNQNQIHDVTCAGKLPMDVQYSNVEGGWSGTGNIDVDPQFVNPIAGNFRLTSTSPCIDAGTDLDIPLDVFDIARTGDTSLPVPDRDLMPRVFGCAVDMGAFEWNSIADLNGDGVVDFEDLLVLLAAWEETCPGAPDPCPGDLNGDDQINIADLLILLSEWSDDCPDSEAQLGSIEECITRLGLSNPAALAACIEAMLLNGTP